ncbi:putative nuclease HARBI1 [Lucilia cuprina]|nr:putative nuclease HARBI1 [Lucilia cuprina]
MFNRGVNINLMEDELEEHEFQVNVEKVYHARPNYLADMDDNEFFKRFRLSNVSSACRAVKDVSEAIAALSGDFIKFNQPHVSTVDAFFRISKFPKVVGTIDCTHVRILSQGGDYGEIFRNRKGYFSINVQAVCEANLIFQDLVARWTGSSHYSMIFNNNSKEFGQLYILGDGGYKASSYMLTPLLNPITRSQKLYNESQIRTRNVVERSLEAMIPPIIFGNAVKIINCNECDSYMWSSTQLMYHSKRSCAS